MREVRTAQLGNSEQWLHLCFRAVLSAGHAQTRRNVDFHFCGFVSAIVWKRCVAVSPTCAQGQVRIPVY